MQDMNVSSAEDSAIEALMREELADAVKDAMGDLPKRLRLVLSFRFGFIDDSPRTLEEVGRESGVTRVRAWQLEKQAFALLKKSGKLPRIEELEREWSGRG